MREDVTITKDVLHEMPNWTHSSEIINNNNPTVYIDDTYKIDLRKTEPRIVFLNQLSEASANGSLAEEIMFIVCPELIVSRFVMAIVGLDRLDEFLSVKGVHVHSVYEGTAKSFKCIRAPPSISIVSTFQVALIAASDFSKDELSQYSKDSVEEELNKALVAFRACGEKKDVVLSGNWGGANLKGDPILKARIQMIAAAKADRRVHYYTFKEPGLADKLNSPLNMPVMNPTTGLHDSLKT
ncbi:poly(ADP-ribose) glycohydrolase-like [Cloeon dipterum]|uniref:poly(ADP-ribose) glycohydrolase-like n=1 Tax=Cloeon dipterum TaxID=197152 RepID=UPI00321F76BA